MNHVAGPGRVVGGRATGPVSRHPTKGTWKLRKHIVIPLFAALALVLLGTAPAQAHDHSYPTPASPTPAPTPAPTPQPQAPPVSQVPLLLGAELSGKQEVPTPGGPAVGDADGRAKARILVLGDKVIFSLQWSGISAPTAFHIHEGEKGVNGPIRVAFFADKLPDSVTAAAGTVTVTDPKLVAAIRSNPAGFYVNVHTAEFPGGAVRGQLKALDLSAGVIDVVRPASLFAFLSGAQEVPVPNGPAVGDPDGLGISFVDAKKDTVKYSTAWVGVGAPVAGHIHRAPAGVNGPVVVEFFTTPIPSSIFAVAGTVRGIDKKLVAKISSHPDQFYVNLHTAEFPGGAIRGQLNPAHK